MLLMLSISTLLMLLITLLPLLKHSHWLIRGLDFPRLQLAILASVLLVADVCILDAGRPSTAVLVIAALFCVVWQMWWILPYTFLWPVEVQRSLNDDPSRQLCILTSNVLTPNRNADALIELVKTHQPDVLVTLESDQWWQERLDVLEADMPYCIKCPLDNLYGMHVYSRLPLEEQEVCYLVEDDVPSMHALIKLRSGEKIRVHFLHPAPPSPTENPQSAERDAELVVVARSVAETRQPVVVTGDLNDVAWSSTTRLFRKISGLLDPRVGRGAYNTFHADYPFLRWPLDHLFHSEHFTLRDLQRLPSIGSDHFPLLARLTFSPLKEDGQNGLEAEEQDREWAREIAEDQPVEKNDVPSPGTKPTGG